MRIGCIRTCFVFAACCIACCFAITITDLPATAAVRQATVIATAGQSAPGTSSTFGSLDNPSIDDSGSVAFHAALALQPALKDEGIWTYSNNSLALVAREGSAAPGPPSTTYPSFDTAPTAYGNGATAFTGFEEVWAGASGNASYFGSDLMNPPVSANDSGEVAYQTTTGLTVGTANHLTNISRSSQAAGLPAGTTYGMIESAIPLNNQGQIAFLAGSNSPNGIWAGNPTNLSLIAYTGQAEPGTGVTFYDMGSPALNNSGQVAFTAIDSNQKYGVWTTTNSGNLSLLAMQGQQAPGTPTGVVFAGLTSATINDAGVVAFDGGLQGPGTIPAGNHGIWLWNQGTLKLLASDLTPAPGFPTGSVLSSEFNPIINNAGLVMFTATVTEPGANSTLPALYIYNTNGTLLDIVQPGDIFNFGNGQMHTLKYFSITTANNTVNQFEFTAANNGTVGPTPLNDNDQLVLEATFTDSTVSDVIITVPEPASVALLITGAIGLLLARGLSRKPSYNFTLENSTFSAAQ